MTKGELSVVERLALSGQALRAAAVKVPRAARGPRGVLGRGRPLDGAPDTQACIEAARLARERLVPAVFEHSVRCYHWGRALASAAGTSVDAEELFIACMLHDVHLGAATDPAAGCFAVLGADTARTVVHGPAAERIANAIERHFDPVPESEPLAAALHDAAHLDVVGYRLGELDREFVRAVCESAPRGDFSRAFLAAIREEARVRPRSIAAAMWWAGIALPVRLNPLDRIT